MEGNTQTIMYVTWTPLYSWELSPKKNNIQLHIYNFSSCLLKGWYLGHHLLKKSYSSPARSLLLGPLRRPIISITVDLCNLCTGTAQFHVDLETSKKTSPSWNIGALTPDTIFHDYFTGVWPLESRNQQKDVSFLKILKRSPHRYYISWLFYRGVASRVQEPNFLCGWRVMS